ncbi:MAG: Holliday junction resolvase RuvX [Chloroflexota bacterium]|nr:Holliday junction resolvase RuvX [Chloroflexota bacterium]
MRILGLDVGSKRIGIALSDPEGVLAIPLVVIEYRAEDSVYDKINGLAEQHNVKLIVVGMPRSLDGNLSKQAGRISGFVSALSERTGLPIETWDERYSTVSARKMMQEAGTKRTHRKKNIDALAATVILQSYLDAVYKDDLVI